MGRKQIFRPVKAPYSQRAVPHTMTLSRCSVIIRCDTLFHGRIKCEFNKNNDTRKCKFNNFWVSGRTCTYTLSVKTVPHKRRNEAKRETTYDSGVSSCFADRRHAVQVVCRNSYEQRTAAAVEFRVCGVSTWSSAPMKEEHVSLMTFLCLWWGCWGFHRIFSLSYKSKNSRIISGCQSMTEKELTALSFRTLSVCWPDLAGNARERYDTRRNMTNEDV